jgi:uncharacterized UPF0160 family protein
MNKHEQIIIVTHDGGFHTDEVFACAALSMYYKDQPLDIIRSRDTRVIETATYVVDVGGVYDSAGKRFDHHQIGGAGERDNGIPYASFGLIWKEFGSKLCGTEEIRDQIDLRLVCPIDAGDNGVELMAYTKPDVRPYLVHNVISKFIPTWKEETDVDEGFIEAVNLAMRILEREIIHTRDALDAKDKVMEAYMEAVDKRMIILDDRYPAMHTLTELPEPLIMVAPRTDGKWKAETVVSVPGTFERRLHFPESWAGLRDEELIKVTGVSTAVFCHMHRFLAVAETRDDAIKLAQLALDQK